MRTRHTQNSNTGPGRGQLFVRHDRTNGAWLIARAVVAIITVAILVIAGAVANDTVAASPWRFVVPTRAAAAPAATSTPAPTVSPAVTAPLAVVATPMPTIVPTLTSTLAATPAAPPRAIPAPALTAKAAFAVDLTHQVELFAENADELLPPASTTKIVTALVTVAHVPLDQSVTIQADDTVDPSIYSHMGLQAGDVVSVHDLLAGLLLNSGGDAALALARDVGTTLSGSSDDPRARFVAEMNRTATKLGMRHTTFLNPDGRDEDGHVTTARDLAIATQALLDNQALADLVGLRTLTVRVQGPAARPITLVNTNELLADPDVHGVKTGTTDAAGECLITEISRNGSRVVTVVLGSSDRYADTRALLDYLDQQYRWLRLGRDGDLADLNATLKEKGYSMAVVQPVLLTAEQAAQLRYEIQLTPNVAASRWSAQGIVVFYVGATPLLRLPLYAGDSTAAPNP